MKFSRPGEKFVIGPVLDQYDLDEGPRKSVT